MTFDPMVHVDTVWVKFEGHYHRSKLKATGDKQELSNCRVDNFG